MRAERSLELRAAGCTIRPLVQETTPAMSKRLISARVLGVENERVPGGLRIYRAPLVSEAQLLFEC